MLTWMHFNVIEMLTLATSYYLYVKEELYHNMSDLKFVYDLQSLTYIL